jgi:hypothetical protein
MATFGEVSDLNGAYNNGSCPDFEENVGSGLLVLLNYFPIILTLSLFLYVELYVYLLSFIGLNLNWLLNFVLRYLIKQPPKYVGCGPTYNMPDFGAQQSIFFACSLLLFACSLGYRVSLINIIFITYFFASVIYARFYIGIASVQQVMAGVLIGAAFAWIFHALLCKFLYKRIDWLLETRLAKMLGVQRGLFAVASYNDDVN